ncbi:MAG: c-type cytochrome, partial [Planctomycetaceae bacterium]|nr:c-type cytochrome [Planctomycetaceae bacterium]
GRGRGRGRGRSGSSGLLHDVAVELQVRLRKDGDPRVSVKVRNRGTSFEGGALLEVTTSGGTTLLSETVDLEAGGKAKFRFTAALPAGTTTLTARADCAGAEDEDPSNNEEIVVVAPGNGSDAALGAALYAANCASCHGTDALGTASGPSVLHEDAEEIQEAVREGEGGMPVFPSIGWAESRRLAAYLRDPSAVTTRTPTRTPAPPPPSPGR